MTSPERLLPELLSIEDELETDSDFDLGATTEFLPVGNQDAYSGRLHQDQAPASSNVEEEIKRVHPAMRYSIPPTLQVHRAGTMDFSRTPSPAAAKELPKPTRKPVKMEGNGAGKEIVSPVAVRRAPSEERATTPGQKRIQEKREANKGKTSRRIEHDAAEPAWVRRLSQPKTVKARAKTPPSVKPVQRIRKRHTSRPAKKIEPKVPEKPPQREQYFSLSSESHTDRPELEKPSLDPWYRGSGKGKTSAPTPISPPVSRRTSPYAAANHAVEDSSVVGPIDLPPAPPPSFAGSYISSQAPHHPPPHPQIAYIPVYVGGQSSAMGRGLFQPSSSPLTFQYHVPSSSALPYQPPSFEGAAPFGQNLSLSGFQTDSSFSREDDTAVHSSRRSCPTFTWEDWDAAKGVFSDEGVSTAVAKLD